MSGETERTDDLLSKAEALVNTLLALVGWAEMSVESAYQVRHEAWKADATELHLRAVGARRMAWELREALAGRVIPSFEGLLRDPTEQFDRDGEVLKSIIGRQTLCITPIAVTSNTPGVHAVLPPTTYLCMKSKPCPDHSAAYLTKRP